MQSRIFIKKKINKFQIIFGEIDKEFNYKDQEVLFSEKLQVKTKKRIVKYEDLIANLEHFRKSKGSLFYVLINGLSEELLKYYDKFSELKVIWTLDTQNQNEIEALNQLWWLKNKKKEFAVISKTNVILYLSKIFGCHSIFVVNEKIFDKQDIESFMSGLITFDERFIPLHEKDENEKKMLSIVAKRNLSKNKIIENKDLMLSNSIQHGLSPYLLKKLIGLRLKYSKKKNERITFGDLLQ